MLAEVEPSPRRTVLIVDDEALVRKTAATMIADFGYTVLQASDAEQAIDWLEERPGIFLVLTDVAMPGSFDGSKLAAFVAGLWPPVRVIVTSGRVDPASVPMADGVSFLAKPYRAEELEARIAELAI